MVPLSSNTRLRLDALFAEPDRQKAADLIAERCAEKLPFVHLAGVRGGRDVTPESLERLRFAVLKLSSGDLGKLEVALRVAEQDWRDSLNAAGFADLKTYLSWWP